MKLPDLGFWIVFSTVAWAQFPPLQPPTEKAGAEVSLSVFARGASGQPVAGLTAADFTLTQDGKSFAVTVLAGNQVRRRAVVLVVDDLGLSLPGIERVRETLRKHVAEQMAPGDLAAVVRTSGGATALLRLTSDKKELAEQLDRIDFYSLADPAGVQPAALLTGTLQGIRSVMEGLQGTSGRKAVVLFSERLRLARQSSTTSKAEEAIGERSALLAGMAGAVLYAIDLRATNPGTTIVIETGIAGLVADTGGLVLAGGSDPGSALERALHDCESSYQLGFQPEESGMDSATGPRIFPRIAVATTRAGVSLAAPDRAYLPGPAPDNSLTATVTPVFSYTPESGSQVNLLLHLDGQTLTSVRDLKGTYRSMVNLSATIFDQDGQAGASVNQSLVAQFTDERLEAVKRSGVTYPFRIPVRGTGLRRVEIRLNDDAGGRYGATSEVFRIPETGKESLLMTGIVLSSRSADASIEQSIQEGPAVRQYRAGTSFRYTYDLYHLIRNAEKQATITTRAVLYRLGQVVSPGELRTVAFEAGDADHGTISGVIGLPKSLAPGRYVLAITASDKLSPQPREATQFVDFRILP